MAHPDACRHASRAPVRSPFGLALERFDDHRLDFIVQDRSRCTNSWLVVQTVEPPLDKALSPLTDSLIRRPQAVGDHRIARLTAPQNNLRAERKAAINARTLREPQQFLALSIRKNELGHWSSRFAHPPNRSQAPMFCDQLRFQGTSR